MNSLLRRYLLIVICTVAGFAVANFGMVDDALAGGPICTNLTVTNTADSGPGSLRDAIDCANLRSTVDGIPSTIDFNIAGGGLKSIFILSNLPALESDITIDGLTQTDAAPGSPTVFINGTLNTSSPQVGLAVRGDNVSLEYLAVGGFDQASGNGIQFLPGSGSGTVIGCFVGIRPDNEVAAPNQRGILIGGDNHTIGGTTSDDRNVISGNNLQGVLIEGGTTSDHLIQGNHIGTNLAGTAARPNGSIGIADFAGSGGHVIVDNLVSGNMSFGIQLSTIGVTVMGNRIGTDASGLNALPNRLVGLRIDNGVLNDIVGNVISGHANGVMFGFGQGVYVVNADNNTFTSNFIGTDVNGVNSLPNGEGVRIELSSDTVFDGDNYVAGNMLTGVIITAGSNNNAFISGFIGLDNNLAPQPNGGPGVIIEQNSSGNLVADTIIGNNLGIGVTITGAGSMDNVIDGAFIGVDLADAPIPNNGCVNVTNAPGSRVVNSTIGFCPGNAVTISGGSGHAVNDNFIGTTSTSSPAPNNGIGVSYSALNGSTARRNTISFSTDGIRTTNVQNTNFIENVISSNTGAGIFGDTGTNIVVYNQNEISNNGALGIDLAPPGPTANDAGDGDGGPNGLQNYPILGDVNPTGGNLEISGTLRSTANDAFNIQIYASSAFDGSGFGEGALFLGDTDINTDGSGFAAFTVTVPDPGAAVITSTARGPLGTSEFSGINTAPILTTPASLTTAEDTLVDVDPAITVTDAQTTVEVTLSVSNGTLTVPSPPGSVSVTPSATDEPTMTLLGDRDDINTLLDDLTYTPDLNYNGPDTLQVSVNDLSPPQLGAPLGDSASVSINVTPVNDAPVANDDSYSTNEDTPLTVNAANGVLDNDTDVENDPLTATLVADAVNGSVTVNSDGSFTYTPDPDFNGSDMFTYRANDGALNSNIATVAITVDPVNDAPVAQDDSFGASEDTQLVVGDPGVLSNDTDVDGDTLNAVLVSNATNGTVALASDGSFTYDPDPDFNGTDSFTYMANDGALDSGVATVTITVAEVNDPPVAQDDSFTTDEDTTLNVAAPGVLSNDSDVDAGDSITVDSVIMDVSDGMLTLNPDGSFTYVPNADFNGTDSFTYQAVDENSATSNTATVTITVNPINDAPVAADDSFATPEDTPLVVAAPGLLANDTDVDGDSLTAVEVTQPADGTVTINADGSFTYTPDLNFVGMDAFTYLANDGNLDSNVATVTVDVGGVNDAPVANDDSYAVDEDNVLTVSAANGVLDNDTDVDGDPLTAALVAGPTNGTLDVFMSDGSFTYTPNPDFNGTDSFTYQANDGQLNSNVATVTITVNPINDDPIAGDDSFTNLQEDLAPTSGNLLDNDSDIDGDALTSVVDTQPSNGSVVVNTDGTFVYTPDPDFAGFDSFTYTAFDGTANSNVATVNLRVLTVNDQPVANDDGYTTDEEVDLVVPAIGVLENDFDVDGDILSATVVTGPTNGTLSFNDGAPRSATASTIPLNLRTTPTTPVTLNDDDTTELIPLGFDFEFFGQTVNGVRIASNGYIQFGTSNTGSDFTSTPAPDADGPEAWAGFWTDFNPAAGGQVLYDVQGNAPDREFVVAWVDVPNFGTTNMNNLQIVINEDTNEIEVHCETCLSDGSIVGGDVATLAVEDSDAAVAAFRNAGENGADFDLINDAVLFTTDGGDGAFTYVPNADFFGTDSFTYTNNDGITSSEVATVTITVNNINDDPIANDDSYSTQEDIPLVVDAAGGLLSNDVDADPIDTLIPTVTGGPSDGSLTVNADGSFTYTPDANFNGSDSFTYTINDGTVDSNEATVDITIVPVNDPPTVVDDTYITQEDQALQTIGTGVSENDFDVEGDSFTIALATGPSNGSIVLLPTGEFTYTPNFDFNGVDSFTYTATDTNGDTSQPATATITVTPVNDAPVAVEDSYATSEDTPLSVGAGSGVLANDSDIDGDTFTAVEITPPANGSLTLNADGSFDYTPNANFNGTDSFRYAADDGTAQSNVVTVLIDVAAVADAPVAGDDSFTTGEDTPLSVNPPGVLSNDSDVDGNSLTAVLVTTTSNGTLALSIDGSFVYTPDANFTGTDSFTYMANDGTLDSNVATVTIDVTPINDAPIAADDAYNVDEDTTLSVNAANGVLANDTDAEGDSLTASLVANVANGSLTLNADGSFDYTPNANFNGTDTFTYLANDGTADSGVATVTITIDPVNDVPAALADTFSTPEDTQLSVAAPGVLSNDSDIDGDPLMAVLVTDVSNGTLTLNADGSFTYDPAAGFNGSDSFEYLANDGTDDSNTVTVSISVGPVNDAPIAVDDSYATDEDTTLTVDVATGVLDNDSDPDGDAITAVLVAGASNGTVTLNADGSFEYIPNANFNGTDTFTYQADDTVEQSAVATVTITVNSVNDAPVANDDSYTTTEDQSALVFAPGVLGNDSDVEGDALTATVVDMPTNGSLTFNADGAFTYTPNANFNGTDSFTYMANDGTDDSNLATATITVMAVNDAPVAVADTYNGVEDTTLTVDAAGGVLANDTDVEGDALTASLVNAPGTGTLTLNADGSFEYIPAPNFTGDVVFTYVANDGALDSAPATVTITIGEANDAPVASDDTYTISEDVTLNIPAPGVLGNDNDPENDTLTAAVATAPANGTLTLNADGSFTYTPDANFNGADTFTYVANDGTADSAAATVTINVDSVNDAPVSTDDLYSTDEDTALVVDVATGVLANDTDADGDSLTASLVAGPSDGTVTLNVDGSFTYTPDPGFAGSDQFTYLANDGTTNSAPAQVRINVGAVNDAPVGNNDSYTTEEDMALNVDAAGGVLANDVDIDGDALTATLVTGPSNGTVTLGPDGSFIYTPDADFNGVDSFTYTASDGELDSATTTVAIDVTSVNDAPVATDDTYNTPEDTDLVVDAAGGVLANDTDAEGDALTATIVDQPANGTLSLGADGSFTYTPNQDYTGTDTFTYTVSDGTDTSNTATVTITVGDLNDPPVFVDPTPEDGTTLTSIDGETITFEIAADDAEGDTLTFTVDGLPDGATFDEGTGMVDYTPGYDDAGTYTVTITVTDGEGSAMITITIEVIHNDDDSDGLVNAFENDFGLNPNDADSDGDTIDDATEVGDINDPSDTDEDETLDALDDDSDGDGILDADEAGDDDVTTDPVDTDDDGTPNFQDLDSDDDSVNDGEDNCLLTPNTDQADGDNDGVGDACTDDRDSDGIGDSTDNCPDDPNAGQEDTDGDGDGDACDEDDDGDGVVDADDLCPTVSDADQIDTDGDGMGDACDEDDDNDTFNDDIDECPLDAGELENGCPPVSVTASSSDDGCCSTVNSRQPPTRPALILLVAAILGMALLRIRRR